MSEQGDSPPGVEGRTLGLILVHGVGRQKPGDMLRNIAGGLRRMSPDEDWEQIANGSLVTIGNRRLRLYEVYWADLLKDENAKGAFILNEFTAVAWFPWFNFRRRCYGGRYSFRRLLPSLLMLPLAGMLFFIAYHGVRMLSVAWDAPKHRERPHRGLGFMERVQRSREAGRNVYSSIDRVLDDFAGDVLTYANSTASTFYRERYEPPATPEMQQAHENIMSRFDAVVAGARADGCDGLQIVAHSLGSVIAYHFLARRSAVDVEHLYTIGSPLQKFDLFWPDIMPQAPQLPARSLAWDNFVSFFDPIAGMLRHFEHWGGVANHRLLGGGFLRGHVVYQHSPVFLRRLSRGVCGMELPLRRTLVERIYDALLLLGETLVTPAILPSFSAPASHS